MFRIRKLIREELQLLDNKVYKFAKLDETPEAPKELLQINYAYDDASVDEALLGPLKYSMKIKGKNIRADFVNACTLWCNTPPEVVTMVMELTYLFHTFSLIIDDIQDGSLLRRGSPCAYLVYGTCQALNTVSYLISYANEMVRQTNNNSALKAIIDLYEYSIRGQAVEIYWRDNFICPTEDEFKLMVMKKTGSFITFISRIMSSYSTGAKDCHLLFSILGLYFQIKDDLHNLTNEDYFKKKGYCEDISEGKFSFPIVYAINNFSEEGKIIKDILKQRTTDIEVLETCRSTIEKTGAFEYTRNILKEYKALIEEEYDLLGPNPLFRERVIDHFLRDDVVLAV